MEEYKYKKLWPSLAITLFFILFISIICSRQVNTVIDQILKISVIIIIVLFCIACIQAAFFGHRQDRIMLAQQQLIIQHGKKFKTTIPWDKIKAIRYDKRGPIFERVFIDTNDGTYLVEQDLKHYKEFCKELYVKATEGKHVYGNIVDSNCHKKDIQSIYIDPRFQDKYGA